MSLITFKINDRQYSFSEGEKISLLYYLRNKLGITSVKDGCSGQAACGACTVEMNGKAVLSCSILMKNIKDANIYTIEGFPSKIRHIIASAFVVKGAIQCGFCTPGILVRTKVLLQNNQNPTRQQIINALKPHFCRCTGYIKICEAIELAARSIRKDKEIKILNSPHIGGRQPKYQAYQKAIGAYPYIDDLKIKNVLFAVLKFCDFPRAKIIKIDTTKAAQMKGVVRIFTAKDIPGERYNGLIINDWPVMVKEGETTRYIGDVLAGVVAESEHIARQAVQFIRIEYQEYEPLTNKLVALDSQIKVHEKGNLLETCTIRRGESAEKIKQNSAYMAKGIFNTQRVEHAFLETEAAVARPWKKDGIEVFVQSQGVYEDRRQLARILGIPESKINVTLVPTGGGFGGKEDLTVQPHVAIFAYLLKKPVKLKLTRAESIRMHPKRHPFYMDYTVCCDKDGNLTLVQAEIVGDTGAYASVGMKVLERAAGHATGAYNVPNVDIVARTVYTNNIPSGAMRGFGVNQVTFALESCIDELCEKGGFDRWTFRYNNALVKGSKTATGQVLDDSVGVRFCLLAIKDEFYKAKYCGLALGLKNTGIGNGVTDCCSVKIKIKSKNRVELFHGWTEMGQGVDTIAIQTLYQETGIIPDYVDVIVSTQYAANAGMTTASRATSLLGNAIIDASKKLKKDLNNNSIKELVGNVYEGSWACDWTTEPGKPGKVCTHYSYGYAAQLVTLDENGKIDTVYAAHDAGKIINPDLFEGQIHGAVLMGLGYALTENLPMKKGQLVSTRLKALGCPGIEDVPKIIVKGVEVKDPLGPYGAKGVGEIGLVPTAAAVANAFYQYDGIRRYNLPMLRD